MTWALVDDNFPNHPKAVKVGPVAAYLFVCGLCYCRRYNTSGFIPIEAVKMLGVTTNPTRLVDLLIDAGFWERVEGGFLVHDYEAVYVDDEGDKARREARREAGRRGGLVSGGIRRSKTEAKAEANHEANVEANLKQPFNQTPSKPASKTEATVRTHPIPVPSQPSTNPLESEGSSRARPSPIVHKRRKDAAFEGPRVYVPQRCHEDFIALRNHPDAEVELFSWYETVSDEWSSGARASECPSADMFAFWKARYNERWPPSPSTSTVTPGQAWAARMRAKEST